VKKLEGNRGDLGGDKNEMEVNGGRLRRDEELGLAKNATGVELPLANLTGHQTN
jgi:hypothetical protein